MYHLRVIQGRVSFGTRSLHLVRTPIGSLGMVGGTLEAAGTSRYWLLGFR